MRLKESTSELKNQWSRNRATLKQSDSEDVDPNGTSSHNRDWGWITRDGAEEKSKLISPTKELFSEDSPREFPLVLHKRASLCPQKVQMAS